MMGLCHDARIEVHARYYEARCRFFSASNVTSHLVDISAQNHTSGAHVPRLLFDARVNRFFSCKLQLVHTRHRSSLHPSPFIVSETPASTKMADMHPLQMARMAIPRPQFFLVVLIGSFLVQFMIAGLRIQHDDKEMAALGSIRTLPSSALLVTAHPDDEAMFFAPAVQALAAAGTSIFALCLSTGNAAGLGMKRTEELFASYDQLGVSASRVKYLDDAKLQDSMEGIWPNEHISSVVAKHIDSLSQPIDALITFDKRGVSEHLNHIAAYNGTRDTAVARNLALYVLPTLEVWEKYTSVPSAVWETISYSGYAPPSSGNKTAAYEPASEIMVLASSAQYVKAVQAMFKHQTQLEWFRYLYLVFSRYMFSNRLVLWTPELDLDLEE
ncbi:glycan biosynthesis protein [Pseudozyma hubeiensis SY62]|uniref:N-acetylglucosaminylphosphatidylinositol deacetylase n=1 Tax=Pseudozyma hubeiensis (strain SY62) TaxID=1305764 RepID=R9P2W8_PSEHS|nr:glycan biosynthesis protein [Pseudozyma hubeiensis SY62]GAC95597.1 glycan biosynthesis protein [Pseudozyma hubeiensis SY62]